MLACSLLLRKWSSNNKTKCISTKKKRTCGIQTLTHLFYQQINTWTMFLYLIQDQMLKFRHFGGKKIPAKIVTYMYHTFAPSSSIANTWCTPWWREALWYLKMIFSLYCTMSNCKVYVSNHETMLLFFLIINARYPCKMILKSRRTSTLLQTGISAHQVFLNSANCYGYCCEYKKLHSTLFSELKKWKQMQRLCSTDWNIYETCPGHINCVSGQCLNTEHSRNSESLYCFWYKATASFVHF